MAQTRSVQPVQPMIPDLLTNPPGSRSTVAKIAAGIVVLIVLCYVQVLNQDFVSFDDNRYITDNTVVKKGLTWEGVEYAFGLESESQYHPLAWLSHMLDVELFGINAGPMKLHNVLVHCINAVLVFLLLRRLSGSLWPAAVMAGVWALHPLRVESVAWASERREVMHSMFGLVTLLAYLSYGQRRTLARYALVYVLFVLTLMSKPMLVTMPCVLLLFDFWPLKRFDLSLTKVNVKRVAMAVVEKLPMVPLIVFSSWATLKISKNANAMVDMDAMPWSIRVFRVPVSYFWYLTSTILPRDLTVLYLFPDYYKAGEIVIAVGALLAITVLVLRLGQKHGYAMIGWFLFLGTLVPVIGFVQVGDQSHADRYTYFPTIGLFIIFTCAATEILKHAPLRRFVLVLICSMLITISWMVSWIQIGYWFNSIALWEHCLDVDEKNSSAHNNLGNSYSNEGNAEKAMKHWKRAYELVPYSRAGANIGALLLKEDKPAEAMPYIANALHPAYGRPGDPLILCYMVLAQTRVGKPYEAVKTLNVAQRSNWTRLDSAVRLMDEIAMVEFTSDKPGGPELCKAIKEPARGPQAVAQLIDAFAARGRTKATIKLVTTALRCAPEDPRWHDMARRFGLDPAAILAAPAPAAAAPPSGEKADSPQTQPSDQGAR